MKYIGLSLGGCLRDIMTGEVAEDDVMFIVTRTYATTFDKYIHVVEQYHAQGNPYSRNPEKYELNDYPLEQVTDLATRLWNSGKIHQPRVVVGDGYGSYRHPVEYGDGVWMQVVPIKQNTNPAVIEAWEKYKVLDALTRD
jgi:hypothetical protein